MPEHDLNSVLARVKERKVRFSESAFDDYQQVTDQWAMTKGEIEKVREEMLQGLLQLKPENFSRTVPMADGLYDEYGLPGYKGWGWYVKFRFDASGWLFNISFHLPVRPVEAPHGSGNVICEKAMDQHRLK